VISLALAIARPKAFWAKDPISPEQDAPKFTKGHR
jgi:hypothetical protein